MSKHPNVIVFGAICAVSHRWLITNESIVDNTDNYLIDAYQNKSHYSCK